ncbi:hypothetical protein AC249_AIPGENE18225, partial [Exaiptasia diaphana]
MHYFIQGLEPSLRAYVILQQPTSLDAAEQVAKIKNCVKESEVTALSISDVMALQRNFITELQKDGFLQNPNAQTPQQDRRSQNGPPPRRGNFGPVPERPQYDSSNQLRRIIREELRAQRDSQPLRFNAKGNFGRATRTTHGDPICS